MKLYSLVIALVFGLVLMAGVRLFEDSSDGHIQTGIEYLDKHNYSLAIRHFDKAIEKNPQSARAFSNRGEVNLLTGNFKSALIDYSNILKLDSNSAEAYCGMAIAYEKIGQFENSLECYRKSIELDQNCAITYHNRAELKRKLGDSSFREDDKRASELGYPEKWVVD